MVSPPPLTALHALLSPEDPSSSTSERAASLAAKLSTATSVLTSPTPVLHSLALEVLSNGLLVQCSIIKFSSPHLPPEGGVGRGEPLTLILGGVWPLLVRPLPSGLESKII